MRPRQTDDQGLRRALGWAIWIESPPAGQPAPAVAAESLDPKTILPMGFGPPADDPEYAEKAAGCRRLAQ